MPLRHALDSLTFIFPINLGYQNGVAVQNKLKVEIMARDSRQFLSFKFPGSQTNFSGNPGLLHLN